MRPLALKNGEVAAARHEAAAERCHCFRHDLAIFIEHRLILDRLGGNHVGLHGRSLLLGLTFSLPFRSRSSLACLTLRPPPRRAGCHRASRHAFPPRPCPWPHPTRPTQG